MPGIQSDWGVGFQASTNDAGGKVFEMLANYQLLPHGGGGAEQPSARHQLVDLPFLPVVQREVPAVSLAVRQAEALLIGAADVGVRVAPILSVRPGVAHLPLDGGRCAARACRCRSARSGG